MKNSVSRLLELDSLRGIAALSVLCYHYTFLYTKYFPPFYPTALHFRAGQYGIQLFFIISGLVIFMTLEKTKDPLDFIVSRFSRLYPCYWLSIVMTFTALKFFPLELPPKFQATLGDAAVNVTMLQEWFGAKHVAGVYWTLTIEMSFYVFIFAIFLLRKLKYIEILGALWLLVMVLNYEMLWRTHLHVPYLLKISNLLLYGHLFYAGIIFYKLKTKGNSWYRHLALAFCFIVQYILRHDLSQSPYSTLYLLFFFGVFYLFVYGRLSWLAQKPLVYLGAISYSLYLIHEFIGYILISRLYVLHAGPLLCFLIPTLGALLTATAMTYLVERPAMDYIKREYKLWKQRTPKQRMTKPFSYRKPNFSGNSP